MADVITSPSLRSFRAGVEVFKIVPIRISTGVFPSSSSFCDVFPGLEAGVGYACLPTLTGMDDGLASSALVMCESVHGESA